MALAKMLVSAAALAGAVLAHPLGSEVKERRVYCPKTGKFITPGIASDAVSGKDVPTIKTLEALLGVPPAVSPEVTTSTGGSSKSNGSTKSNEGTAKDSLTLPGISYAPYRADHGCKTKEQIDADMASLKGKYSYVRIYGTDCDQVPVMHAAAKANGMKMFLGIWDINDVANEARKIVEGIDGDWDCVHTVSVANELVNNGQASPGSVVNAVKQARSLLRDAGYQGPVVAVDTFMAVKSHPELCTESDYCAINAHPFFDATISAGDAGSWLARTIAEIKDVLPADQRIVVTETGWPTEGLINGLAVPGRPEQRAALDSIMGKFADTPEDLVLFSAFNDMWKDKNPATFNADPFWGIDGALSASDK